MVAIGTDVRQERRYAPHEIPIDHANTDLSSNLCDAIREGNLEMVKQWVQRGASVNASVRQETEGSYITVLSLASMMPESSNALAIMEFLLDNAAKVDGRGSQGETPLTLACAWKNIPAVKLLLNRGADLKVKGQDNIAALGTAAGLFPTVASSVPFASIRAAELIKLLVHLKASLEDEQMPAIDQAVKTNNILAVQVLIESGAPVIKSPLILHTMLNNVPIESASSMCRLLLHSLADIQKVDHCARVPLDVCEDLYGTEVNLYTILRESYTKFMHRFDSVHDLVGRNQRKVITPTGDTEVVYLEHGASFEDSEYGEEINRPVADSTKTGLDISWYKGFMRRVEKPSKRLNRDIRFQLCMLFVLLFALFLPDIWVLTESDPNVLDSCLVVVMVAFIFEFFVQLFGMRYYFGTFFFFMDILGALSVIIDFSSFQMMLSPSNDLAPSTDQLVVTQTARLAKLGARAGRFSKLVKLLRFLPGVRSSEDRKVGTAEGISSQLNHTVTTRVAILMIILVVTIPAFGMVANSYPEQDLSLESWSRNLLWTYMEMGEAKFEQLLRECELFFVSGDARFFPYKVEIESALGSRQYTLEGDGWTEPFRPQDNIYRSTTVDQNAITMSFNFASAAKIEAGMNMVLISFVMLVMVFFCLLISNVISRMVLRPLDSLLRQVQTMASTIYSSVSDMSSTLKKEDELEAGGVHSDTLEREYDPESALGAETALLEKVVQKLAVLCEITLKNATIDAETMEALNTTIVAPVEEEEEVVACDNEEVEEFVSNQRIQLASAGVNLTVVQSWDFNPHDLDWHQLCAVTSWIFYGDSLISQWMKNVLQVDCASFQNFIQGVANGYVATNPYHSWIHGVDVTHAVYLSMRVCRAETFLNVQERFGLLVAAMSHDVGHPGYNNHFLVETSHKLALRYNDKSPLENMHCARLFQMATQDESTAIFNNLAKGVYSEVRKVCVDAIFHTDMVHHFPLVKEIQMMYEVSSDAVSTGWDPDLWSEDRWHIPPATVATFAQNDNRRSIRNLLLHLSDISNSTKPFIVCRRWANYVLDEFFLQGDKEKELGIPVQILNDRDKVNRPFSQIGFIEFIVAPLMFASVRLFPPLAQLGEQMTLNARNWHAEWLDDTEPTVDADAAVQERLAKLEQGFADATFPGK